MDLSCQACVPKCLGLLSHLTISIWLFLFFGDGGFSLAGKYQGFSFFCRLREDNKHKLPNLSSYV